MGASNLGSERFVSATARSAFAVFLAASMCALPLTGCSSNAEDSQTPQEMEQARKADDQKAIEEAMAQRARQAATPEAQEQAEQARAALESVFGALGSDGGSTSQDMLSAVWFDPADFGISWAAFSETYYDGFTWEFGEATGDGQGSATVEATLHVKQMARGIGLMRQAMESAQAQGADVAQTGSADDAFSQAVSGADWPCDDIRVEVELERGSDGQWAVANRQVLAAALLDGYDPRQAS